MALKWEKDSNYSIKSGRYVISRQSCGDRDVYTLWVRGRWYGHSHRPIGYFETADEAKNAADKFASRSN